MKKLIAILAGFLTLFLFIGIAWLLYSTFGSTIIVILNIIIVMIGVLLGFTIYSKLNTKKTSHKEDVAHFPEIEMGKILVNPQSFIENFEPLKGDLYLATSTNSIQQITLKKVTYDKLTDELTFLYSDGVKTKMRDVKAISVGDFQFLIYQFDEILHYNGKENIHLKQEGKRIIQKVGTHSEEHRFAGGTPIYLFSWREEE